MAAQALKTEHGGAKNGGGYWGVRTEAKRRSRKVRRANDKVTERTWRIDTSLGTESP